jgi:hypothetical protein
MKMRGKPYLGRLRDGVDVTSLHVLFHFVGGERFKREGIEFLFRDSLVDQLSNEVPVKLRKKMQI